MAIYRCEECNQLIDDDYFPCVEHPTDPTAFCCESCAQELEEECDEDTLSDRQKAHKDAGMKESDFF